jgi:hypothetical protein
MRPSRPDGQLSPKGRREIGLQAPLGQVSNEDLVAGWWRRGSGGGCDRLGRGKAETIWPQHCRPGELNPDHCGFRRWVRETEVGGYLSSASRGAGHVGAPSREQRVEVERRAGELGWERLARLLWEVQVNPDRVSVRSLECGCVKSKPHIWRPWVGIILPSRGPFRFVARLSLK